jgi:UDP-N-acetyl-D-glucosamine dehydrogenase
VISLCLPIPLNLEQEPDLNPHLDALGEVRKNLRKGQMILLESTVPPGLTEETVIPFLETSGFKVGQDFYLAFSPERIDPGNNEYKIHNIPKLVSGPTPSCTEAALAFYKTFISSTIPISSIKVTELARVLENTFRAVNIAFVHEFSEMCDHLGVQVGDVVEAAASKPFGFMPFKPGPGVGGHCVPVAPHYLQWALSRKNYKSKFLHLTEEINSARPAKVIQKIKDILQSIDLSTDCSKIILLGVAYKEEQEDARYSPALSILEGLRKEGVQVSYHDPYVPKVHLWGSDLFSENPEDQWSSYDLVVLHTAHRYFDLPLILKNCRRMLDTKNATRNLQDHREKIIHL